MKSEIVLDSMAELKRKLDCEQAKMQKQTNPLVFESAFLSDSIALSLSVSDKADKFSPDCRALTVICVADILSQILAWSARSEAPLAYRGAVAYGEYEFSSNFLLGEAVDDAASAYELAQGAFIWLTPSARKLVGDWLKNKPKNTHLVWDEVPLKGGDRFPTYSVSPIEQAETEDDAKSITSALLGTFKGPNLDVMVKRENTVRHLVRCYSWRGWKPPSDLICSQLR